MKFSIIFKAFHCSTPKLNPDYMNTEVKLLKAEGIILGWVTFLALDFRRTLPTYGPPNHSGGIQMKQIFTMNHVRT